MSAESIFNVVEVFGGVLPCLIALGVVHFLPRPRHNFARSIFGIIAGWAFMVFYTIVAYNPAGIAAATEQGVDSPAMLYDNNTTASALVAGWLLPSACVAIYFLVRRFWRRNQEA